MGCTRIIIWKHVIHPINLNNKYPNTVRTRYIEPHFIEPLLLLKNSAVNDEIPIHINVKIIHFNEIRYIEIFNLLNILLSNYFVLIFNLLKCLKTKNVPV